MVIVFVPVHKGSPFCLGLQTLAKFFQTIHQTLIFSILFSTFKLNPYLCN